ncbi:GAF and ANTAR domain-containing protein [Pseudonocardia halophobica]|uniref:GAF and ANTAR domain-containing protein n=1 Tax=Pseudonocardia halophobica TaxID=29401 RepID=UPI003D8F2707
MAGCARSALASGRLRSDFDALRRHTADPAPARYDGPGPTPVVPDLTEALEETGRALLAARDADGICAAAVGAVRRAVPAAVHVGLLLADRATGVAVGAVTDPSAELACALQARLGEGPGPDALRDGVPVVVDDLGAADVVARWPGFSGPMSRLGLCSTAAFPLVAGSGRPAAALVLFAPAPDAFGADEVVRGRLCATQASVALAGARQADNLVRALGSRDVIGQAKGALMHAHGVDERTAFEMLRRTSRDTNTKLVEIARRVVAGDPS